MHGDQARQLLGGGVAEPLGDARGLHAHARGAGQLEADQLAVLGFVGLPARHGPFLQLLAVDRIDDAGAAGSARKMPSNWPRARASRLMVRA